MGLKNNFDKTDFNSQPSGQSKAQIGEQMSSPYIYVFTIKFLALIKCFFMFSGPIKFKKFNYTKCIMQLFSAETIVFSKKKIKVLTPQNMKKPPSKVAHNRPHTFFHLLARLPKRPRNRNPVQPKAP